MTEDIELNLSKEDLDKLSEFLNSDSFRNYGFGHITFVNGDMIFITCEELIKNREEYEKHLIESGLKSEEVIKHMQKIDNLNK